MLGLIVRLLTAGGLGLSKTGPNTGTVTGTVAKTVTCAKCQSGYVYMVTRSATGRLSSPTGKEYHTAGHALEVLLDNAVELVPCPSCGWLQADMMPIARAKYKTWMTAAGGITLLVGILSMLLGLAALAEKSIRLGMWEVVGSCLLLVLSMGLYAGHAYLASRFDPNTMPPETQKAIGQRLSIPQEDYEKQSTEVLTQKIDRREQAKRNMASGYGLPEPVDELANCQYCGYQQRSKNKICASCKRTMHPPAQRA